VSTATLHTNRGDIVIDLFDHQGTQGRWRTSSAWATGTKEYTDATERREDHWQLLTTAWCSTGHRRLHDPGRLPSGETVAADLATRSRRFHPELTCQPAVPAGHGQLRPGTNGSQFFNHRGPTPHLNRKHTIFGEVTTAASKKVRHAISTTPVRRADRPKDAVVINSVTVA